MQRMTRRALVLTNEAAGHPFRRSLPPHVFAEAADMDEQAREDAHAARRWRLNGSDWRGFLAAYTASLVVVSIFIA